MCIQLWRPISIGILVLTLALGLPLMSRADEAQTLYNQGATLYNQQKFKEAAQSLEKALKVFPNFAAAHHLLALSHLRACSNTNRPSPT